MLIQMEDQVMVDEAPSTQSKARQQLDPNIQAQVKKQPPSAAAWEPQKEMPIEYELESLLGTGADGTLGIQDCDLIQPAEVCQAFLTGPVLISSQQLHAEPGSNVTIKMSAEFPCHAQNWVAISEVEELTEPATESNLMECGWVAE
uniref:Uncharacterized protein n=1 Tax=Sphaerodactylus townsendi TaxID=933632 RepID=A0ACB8F3H5_9SAUR